jgi:hypothetical protein
MNREYPNFLIRRYEEDKNSKYVTEKIEKGKSLINIQKNTYMLKPVLDCPGTGT